MAECGEVDGDRQIAAFVLLDLLAIDIERLLAHNGFEVQGDDAVLAFGRQPEVLTIPHDALIVAATAGFGRHELYGMGRCDHLPRAVVEVGSLSTGNVATMEAPACVEVPHLAAAILQGEEACNGGGKLSRRLSIRDKHSAYYKAKYESGFLHHSLSYWGLL